MAGKILAVLKYGALAADLKRESAKEIKGFSWGKAADKVIQVYKELV
jgi:glycosyltransferase involved in cell wall biosynthesis